MNFEDIIRGFKNDDDDAFEPSPETKTAQDMAQKLLVRDTVAHGVVHAGQALETGIDPASFYAGFMWGLGHSHSAPARFVKEQLSEEREFVLNMRETVDV
jgi:hypothetical protein